MECGPAPERREPSTLGPAAEAFLRAAAAAGTTKLGTEIALITGLKAAWGREALVAAVERAAQFRRFRAADVRSILELWVLRGAQEHLDPPALRGLLHLAQAAEEIGDAAQQLVWLVQEDEELHPILAIALGHSDEVVVRVPVAAGAPADGASLASLCMETETGFYLLAIRRGGRYLYRPRANVVLQSGDDLIATGPDEGHALLAELCGYVLIEDEDTGEDQLVPAGTTARGAPQCEWWPAPPATRAQLPRRNGVTTITTSLWL